LLSAFYARAKVDDRDPFVNVAIPFLPFSFFIDKKGVHKF